MPPPETIRPRRHSLATSMVVVALAAADLAALRPAFPLEISIFWTSYPWSIMREVLPPRFPNLGLALVVLLLEAGLFRMASKRGVERSFWLDRLFAVESPRN
jgi:hypothetical protein